MVKICLLFINTYNINLHHIYYCFNIAFSGGSRISHRGRGPPMQVLFSENVCKNERIGSHRGWRALGTSPPPPDPPMALPLFIHTNLVYVSINIHIFLFLNVAPSQNLFFAPRASIRINTVS